MLWLIHTARDRDRDRKQWVSILRYVLYTLHRHRDWYMELCYCSKTKFVKVMFFLSVCSQGGLHPGGLHPPIGYHGIWSTSGQYASYWNAFLFSIVPIPFPVPVPVPVQVPCSVSEPLVSDLVSGSVSALPLISLWSNKCHITWSDTKLSTARLSMISYSWNLYSPNAWSINSVIGKHFSTSLHGNTRHRIPGGLRIFLKIVM